MGGEAEGKMHGQHFCSHRTSFQKLPSEIVKHTHTLYLLGFRAYKSPAHFM